MKRIGVVGVGDGWSSNKLADAIEQKTGYRLLIEMDKVVFDVATGIASFQGVELNSLDAIMVKKIGHRYSPDLLSRLELLRYLNERRGLPIFSTPDAMIRAVDRMNNTLALRGAGIPMPPTRLTEDIDEAVKTMQEFGTSVLKPLYSSKARGMMVVDENSDHYAEANRFKKESNSVFYIQQLIEIPGHDLGVVFLGGKYLATYARVAGKDSWNTTIRAGGRYQPVEPEEEIIEIARLAQSAFNLDFTSVDVVVTDQGPFVFEVSAFGGFRGLQESHGIDAAELYADYVLEKIS